MAYPIKTLRDEHNELFIPYTTSTSVATTGGQILQNVLDVKLDPADVKSGSDIKVTQGTDNVTVAWVRPTNLTVKNQLDVTASGQGVLDAAQGKVLNDKFNNYILKDTMGKANGVATLGSDGKVPSGQLPAYVDDVIESYIVSGSTALSSGWLSTTSNGSAFTPETGKIYVIMSSGSYQNKQYRWGGSTYVLCNPSDVNSVNGMTGVVTLKTLTLKTAAGSANTVNETFNAGADKTVTINVPSKTSHITNDSGFITASSNITGNAATATTADKTKGTLTIKMKDYDTNTETTEAFNGNSDKTITIGVPTKVSQLTNDSQYITASASITGNAATATTASKTTGTFTIQKNGTNVATFNGSANKTANIVVPTKYSDLTPDITYLTSVPVASSTVSGTIKIGTGLAINDQGVAYVTGEGVSADEIAWENVLGKPTNVSYFTNDAGYITASDFIEGNAATASKLQTARTINGTSFDGSQNITTANWGTARNISIADSDATNTGTAVSVNGSGAVTLKLPATIKATLSGKATSAGTADTASKTTGTFTIQKNGTNITTFNGSGNATANITFKTSEITNDSGYITSSASITGNAKTATTLETARTINGTSFNGSQNITTANWGTARNITISDSDGTNSGTAVSVNGSAAVTLKLPATIKATLSGNASSATKATQDGSGNTITSTYFKASGGTITGAITRNLSGDTIAATNLFTVAGSTDGFKVDYACTTADAGITSLYTTDDANASIVLGNNISGTLKTAITITNGSAAITGSLSGNATTATTASTANATKASLKLTKNRSDISFNGSAAQTVIIPTIHNGPGVPAASLGQDGDIYIVTG